jgi:hypothetical protein
VIDAAGEQRVVTVDSPTVVVAVKTDCLGCRTFYAGDLSPLDGFGVVILTAEHPTPENFPGAVHQIYRAPDVLSALGITAAPFFVLVETGPTRVSVEGLAFDPRQVAFEISRTGRVTPGRDAGGEMSGGPSGA